MSKNNGFTFGIGGHSYISASEIMNTKIDKPKEEEVVVESQAIEETQEVENTNNEDCSFVVASRSRASKKADTKVSTSIALTPEANDILLKVMKLDDSMKANTTINKVLETCYNAETKTFKQEVPAKDVSSNINYSVQISKKHRDALAKEAKKRNMTVGEYLSELVLRTIKFN